MTSSHIQIPCTDQGAAILSSSSGNSETEEGEIVSSEVCVSSYSLPCGMPCQLRVKAQIERRLRILTEEIQVRHPDLVAFQSVLKSYLRISMLLNWRISVQLFATRFILAWFNYAHLRFTHSDLR